MSELLFECYHVPQVTYGIDAMFSLYANHDKIGLYHTRLTSSSVTNNSNVVV
jgi:actin-related protein 5